MMNNAGTMYHTHEERLTKMTKKAIIEEGVAHGFWANTDSNIAYLAKQKKSFLVHRVARCHTMLSFRGYY